MNSEEKNNLSFERPPMPDAAKGTGTYLISTNLGFIGQELEKVPDLVEGGKITRRFGAWLGMHIVPNLDKATQLNGPVILPAPPAVFIDADDLEQLKARLYYEIDVMIQTVKEVKEHEENQKIS